MSITQATVTRTAILFAAALLVIVALGGNWLTFNMASISHPSDHSRGPQPRLFAPGVVSTGYDESHPTFSPDGKTLYFLRNSPDFSHWTVLQTRNVQGKWTKAEVAPFSGRWDDADLFFTKDGSFLFFVSNRPAPGRSSDREDTDLWFMKRQGHGWTEPRHIPELSSAGYEWFPTITDDGFLYFGSERPGGLGASDIWRAKWDGHSFSELEHLPSPINSSEQEIEPLIDPKGEYLILAARRDARSKGAYDLFISYNCSDRWTDPTPLPDPINSAGWDFGPRLSPDGEQFLFTSSRNTTPKKRTRRVNTDELHELISSPGNGLRDIYAVDAAALPLKPPCDG